MGKYTWILFDADGTLFDYNEAEQYALKESFVAHDIPYVHQYLQEYARINTGIWQEFEQGQITASALRAERFRRLFTVIGVGCSPEEFGATYLKKLSQADFLIAGALELVADLSHGYKLAVVTNGLTDVQRSRFGKSPITQYFSALVISEEIGEVKPDSAYFDHVFDLMGHPQKESVLIVGDSLSSDIQGGINYGIDTCWYNPLSLPYTLDIPSTHEISELKELRKIVSVKV
jgi:2-haloacid dehalogenase